MRFFKRLITLGWIIALLMIGCLLYIYNSQPVVIDLVWIRFPELSLAVVLFAIFFIGLVSGILLTFIASFIPTRLKKADVR